MGEGVLQAIASGERRSQETPRDAPCHSPVEVNAVRNLFPGRRSFVGPLRKTFFCPFDATLAW